jgi:gas vesicle protein
MDERTTLVAGSVVGAVIGMAVSYLFFTRRGRALRRELEPVVEEFLREAARFQQAVQQVREEVVGTGGRDGGEPSWPRRSA